MALFQTFARSQLRTVREQDFSDVSGRACGPSRPWRRLAAIVMVATMLATSVHAVDLSSSTETREREPNPRAALTAVAMNIFFLPVRLPITVLGAFFAGFTGFMTFGGKYAADDVFAAVDGTQVIDEHVVEGREPFCIGRYDCPR